MIQKYRFSPLASLIVLIYMIPNILPWHLLPISNPSIYVRIILGVIIIFFILLLKRGNLLKIYRLSNPEKSLLLAQLIIIVFSFGYWSDVNKIVIYAYTCLIPLTIVFLLRPFSLNFVYSIIITIFFASLVSVPGIYKDSFGIEQLGVEDTIGTSRLLGLTGVICFSLLVTKRSNTLSKFLLPLIFTGIFFFMLAIGQRGPILSLLCVALLYFIINIRKRALALQLSIIFIALVILTISSTAFVAEFTANSAGFRRLLSISTQTYSNDSDLGRADRIRVSINAFSETRGIGLGTGGFTDYYADNGTYRYNETRDYPHNIFFEFLAEQGIIGILAISALSIYLVFISCKMMRSQEAISVSLGMMLGSSFLNSLASGDVNSNNWLWFLCSIAFAFKGNDK